MALRISSFLQLEDAQGAPDAEAQQALRTLQEQMRNLEHAQRTASEDSLPQAKGSAPSDIEIASSIDRCFLVPPSGSSAVQIMQVCRGSGSQICCQPCMQAWHIDPYGRTISSALSYKHQDGWRQHFLPGR